MPPLRRKRGKPLKISATAKRLINLLKYVTGRKLADGASLQDHLTESHNDWARLKDMSLKERENFPKPL